MGKFVKLVDAINMSSILQKDALCILLLSIRNQSPFRQPEIFSSMINEHFKFLRGECTRPSDLPTAYFLLLCLKLEIYKSIHQGNSNNFDDCLSRIERNIKLVKSSALPGDFKK